MATVTPLPHCRNRPNAEATRASPFLGTRGHAHGDRSCWRNPREQQRRNWDDGALRA